MYLKEILVDNFRNLKKQKIEFCSGLNLIYGLNAQGKSNLIEAIRILSMGRSFRGSKMSEIIKFGEEYFFIRGIVESNAIYEKKIEFGYRSNGNKVVKVNGNKLKTMGEILGHFLTVIFSPEDIGIIKEGPSRRRKYLDSCISVIDKNYFFDLLQYNRALSNRNSLLRKIREEGKGKDLIEIFDEKLSEYGARIIKRRGQYIDKLKEIMTNLLMEISNEKLDIVYLNSVGEKEIKDENFIKEKLKDKLSKSLPFDVQYMSTRVGPHREDFKVIINGYDSRIYSSQGQKRTIVLALKLSELEILKEETGEKPVLLLDDVMSELDENRKRYVLKKIKEIQSFITHTTRSDVKGDCIFRIHDGIVMRE
ncbi:MAG: DNA replication/repair protein RecF [Caldanaerobacter sp.]